MRYIFLLTLCLCCFGCSTPEGDDMSSILARIAALSPAAHQALRVAVGKKKLYEFYSSKDENEEVMHFECRSRADGAEWGPWARHETYLDPADDPEQHPIRVVVDYLLDKLRHDDMTGQQIFATEEVPVANNEAWKMSQATGKDVQCRVIWNPGYETVPDISDPDRVTDDDIAKELFRSAALAAIVFGTDGAGEPALGPLLCPLSDWRCPTDPDYPPGQTPQPGDQP